MRTFRLTLDQVRYVNKAFWRNPARAFFTFALPLIFLLIFTGLLGDGNYIRLGKGLVKASTYYVAAMAAWGVLVSCYGNLVNSMTAQREAGILKRANGTPLSGSSFIASRVLHSVAIAVILVGLTAVYGRAAFGANIPTGMALFHFLVVLLVGAAAFGALGLAVSSVIPNADASSPVVMATTLPLSFLSGIFISFGNSTPSWITWVARIFPVRPFVLGMQSGFMGTPFSWVDVGCVAAWGVAGLLFAIRFFRWEARSV